ncbi:MAG: HAD-IB family hydrolase [Actinobacteria bacterium]|nr:HAD-IB family hydrolase [Actinomycetota bacterium]
MNSEEEVPGKARHLTERSRRRQDLRNLSHVEAAFFDLDKTVIAKSSVLAFGRPLYREGLLSRRAIVRSMYAQVVFMLVGADEAKMEKLREAMLGLTRGWDQAHVAQIVRETLDEVVSPIIFAEALELFTEHHAAGREVVIVSSAPAEVVEPLAAFLGADRAIATRAELDEEGRYTGQLAFYAYGPYKAEAVRELALRDGIDLSRSYAYSDSVTDVPMLEAVGHPVAVNADRELARVAKERGWEVRDFRQPVRLRDRVPPRGPTIAVSGALAFAGAGAAAMWWWRRHERLARHGRGAGVARARAVSGDAVVALRHSFVALGAARRIAAGVSRS